MVSNWINHKRENTAKMVYGKTRPNQGMDVLLAEIAGAARSALFNMFATEADKKQVAESTDKVSTGSRDEFLKNIDDLANDIIKRQRDDQVNHAEKKEGSTTDTPTVNLTNSKAAMYEALLNAKQQESLGNPQAASVVRNLLSTAYVDKYDSIIYEGEPPTEDELMTLQINAIKDRVQAVIDPIYRANLAKKSISAAIQTCTDMQLTYVESGRLWSSTESRYAMEATLEVVAGQEVGSNKLLHTDRCGSEVRQIIVHGTIPRLNEDTNKAKMEAAIMEQLGSGRAITGTMAPGLGSQVSESELTRMLEANCCSTPQAAATVMVTSIYGWIMHMLDIQPNVKEKRTYDQWVDDDSKVSVRGYGKGDVVTGMGINDANLYQLPGNQAINQELEADEYGSLFERTNYAERLTLARTSEPQVGDGWYLLTIPKRNKANNALTAAAMAITRGKPKMVGARGHHQLMAVASACNVSFIRNIGSSSDVSERDFAEAAFSVEDMIDLLGWLVLNHYEKSHDAMMVAANSVAALFQNVANSHHDPNDVLAAGIQRIGHSNCEPAIGAVVQSTSSITPEKLPNDSSAAGAIFLDDINSTVGLHGLGLAMANIAVEQQGALALTDGDVLKYQSDRAYNLILIGKGRELASTTPGIDIKQGSIDANTTELASVALNALGFVGSSLRLTGGTWSPRAIPRPRGCVYIRDNLEALVPAPYKEGQYEQDDVDAILSFGPGEVSTLTVDGARATSFEQTAQVVDCGYAKVLPHEEKLKDLWQQNRAEINKIARLMKTKGIRPRMAAHEFTDVELDDVRQKLALRQCNLDRIMDALEAGATTAGQATTVVNLHTTARMQYAEPEQAPANMPEMMRQEAQIVMLCIADIMDMCIGLDNHTTMSGAREARQAVAIGWWHASDAGRMSRVFRCTQQNKRRPLMSEGFLANKNPVATTSTVMNASCISTLADILGEKGIYMTVAAPGGMWATIGATIIGSGAVPAALQYWEPQAVMATVDPDNDKTRTLVDTVQTAVAGTMPLSAKFSTSNDTRRGKHVIKTKKLAELKSRNTSNMPKSALTCVNEKISAMGMLLGVTELKDAAFLATTDPTTSDKTKPDDSLALRTLHTLAENIHAQPQGPVEAAPEQ